MMLVIITESASDGNFFSLGSFFLNAFFNFWLLWAVVLSLLGSKIGSQTLNIVISFSPNHGYQTKWLVISFNKFLNPQDIFLQIKIADYFCAILFSHCLDMIFRILIAFTTRADPGFCFFFGGGGKIGWS